MRLGVSCLSACVGDKNDWNEAMGCTMNCDGEDGSYVNSSRVGELRRSSQHYGSMRERSTAGCECTGKKGKPGYPITLITAQLLRLIPKGGQSTQVPERKLPIDWKKRTIIDATVGLLSAQYFSTNMLGAIATIDRILRLTEETIALRFILSRGKNLEAYPIKVGCSCKAQDG